MGDFDEQGKHGQWMARALAMVLLMTSILALIYLFMLGGRSFSSERGPRWLHFCSR